MSPVSKARSSEVIVPISPVVGRNCPVRRGKGRSMTESGPGKIKEDLPERLVVAVGHRQRYPLRDCGFKTARVHATRAR